MRDILVGCGQITWIRFKSNRPERLASEEQVLTEIAQRATMVHPRAPSRRARRKRPSSSTVDTACDRRQGILVLPSGTKIAATRSWNGCDDTRTFRVRSAAPNCMSHPVALTT